VHLGELDQEHCGAGSAPILRSSCAVADYTEIRDVVGVQIWEDRDITLTLF
jgi:hypothetical protein